MSDILFKEYFEELIQKYGGKYSKTIGSRFVRDFINITSDNDVLNVSKPLSNQPEVIREYTDTINILLDLEYKIKNPLFFWSIYPIAYQRATHTQNFYEKFLISFTRPDRLKLGLTARKKQNNVLNEKILKINGHSTSGIGKERKKKFSKKIRKLEKTFKVYRGFTIRKDEDVRVGRYKINNPNWESQDKGLGLSFTTDRVVANYFATQYRIETGTFGEQKFIWTKNREFKFAKELVDESLIDETSRRVVGTYLANKEDILFYNNSMFEEEVMIDPQKVKLFRYDFLNIKDKFQHPLELV
jgi:hypothetical protein